MLTTARTLSLSWSRAIWPHEAESKEANLSSGTREIPCLVHSWNWRFITVLTTARTLSLSWSRDLSRRAAAGRSPAEIVGFESHRGHGYLSVVSVVCCQVEVSATSWSLVQRSPTVLRRCVWSRNIKNECSIYIYMYGIIRLKFNDLTLILLTWRKWWANNASK